MDPITMAIMGVQALTSVYDSVKGEETKDRAFSKFLNDTTSLAEEEKEMSIKYGDIAADMRDPSSYWMQNVKKDWLDAVDIKSDKVIKKLRGSGIYSPSLERLITQDFSIQGADEFTGAVADMANTASQYDALSQKSFSNYTDTLASAYTTQFTGTLSGAPSTASDFASTMEGVSTAMTLGESLGDMFG